MYVPSNIQPFNLTVGDNITASIPSSQFLYLYLYQAGADLLDRNAALISKE